MAEAVDSAREGEPEEEQSPRRKLRLDGFLKFVGASATGGQAKLRIQAGDVWVNGVIETRRGRGLKPGDRVEVDGRTYPVTDSLWT